MGFLFFFLIFVHYIEKKTMYPDVLF
ncbi:hypothetical protein [Christensenella tenuis]